MDKNKNTAKNILNPMKVLERKERELKFCEAKLLRLSDEIHLVADQRATKRMTDKSKRVAEMRISTHMAQVAIDSVKRPSDRAYSTRDYTQADKDTWRFEDMRGWYNKYASEEEKYDFIPWKTGYTLRLQE